MDRPIYLDHNATTPVLPAVAEAMRCCYAEPYYNPSSQHQPGRRARQVLEDARERIAELLGADLSAAGGDRVIFTSGGTEANNLAIRGLALRPGHVVVSAVEHPSVSAVAEHLATEGWGVDRLAVAADGVARVEDLPQLLRDGTQLVCLMLGQNETGVLQPVEQAADVCRRRGIPLHTDAAQVVGKLPVDFRALGAATLSTAAHKFHGPLGIGALLVRGDVDLAPCLRGGFQQAGLRPGTESVPLVVGMLRALELWHAERDERAARMARLRDRFEQAICCGWPESVVVGQAAPRLPHTTNIAFVGHDRQALFMALDQAGVACSTGSACASGSSEPSPALVAMGAAEAVVGSALRFSLGATTTEPEVDEAAARILRVCNGLRRQKEG